MNNQAKILRGAFVEFGISLPPLLVVFQFNPLTITRTRAATPKPPKTAQGSQSVTNLAFVQQLKSSKGQSLTEFRNGATLDVRPETMTFDIRLDATDRLNEGDSLTQAFGIAPQLSTLELMMLPKSQSLLGGAVAALLDMAPKAFTFASSEPPVILLVWGRKKVLPVNITNMQIKEEEFSVDLNPTRATVTVSLEVIEGPNLPFLYTKAMREAMSLLNLANIGQIANTIVPG